MVPGIRSFISIPPGMSRMPILPFLTFTALGSIIWTTLLTIAGYYFGENYEVIETMLAPYSKGFLLLTIFIIIAWFMKRRLTDQHN